MPVVATPREAKILDCTDGWRLKKDSAGLDSLIKCQKACSEELIPVTVRPVRT